MLLFQCLCPVSFPFYLYHSLARDICADLMLIHTYVYGMENDVASLFGQSGSRFLSFRSVRPLRIHFSSLSCLSSLQLPAIKPAKSFRTPPLTTPPISSCRVVSFQKTGKVIEVWSSRSVTTTVSAWRSLTFMTIAPFSLSLSPSHRYQHS